jgi:hypothetical protein
MNPASHRNASALHPLPEGPRRARRFAIAGIAALPLLVAAALGLGALSPVSVTDPEWVTAGKLFSKKHLGRVVILATAILVPGAFEAAGPATPIDGAGFYYEKLDHPYLARIRLDERVRHFYASGTVDLDEAVAMADFLRDQFPRGRPGTDPAKRNLLELLDGAEAGESFLCDTIARMLAQMMQAGGTHARRVRLRHHVVAEIWSAHWKKWVVVDPHFNVHFTNRGGVPLSSLDVHRLAPPGLRDQIVVHPGLSENTLYRPGRFDNLVDRYVDGVAVDFGSKWFSHPLPYWHPVRAPLVNAVFYSESGLAHHPYFPRAVKTPDVLFAPPDGGGAARTDVR